MRLAVGNSLESVIVGLGLLYDDRGEGADTEKKGVRDDAEGGALPISAEFGEAALGRRAQFNFPQARQRGLG